MIDLILRTATRLLIPLMGIFSIFVLVRGHNAPGGGFAGGLIASAALALYVIAFGVPAARQLLRFDPRMVATAGLGTAVASGLPALLIDRPFLTGRWLALELPGITLDIGTPLLFDFGVYLLVAGAVLTIIFTMSEE